MYLWGVKISKKLFVSLFYGGSKFLKTDCIVVRGRLPIVGIVNSLLKEFVSRTHIMEYPFTITDDVHGVRNEYNIVPNHPDVVYIDIVTEYIYDYDFEDGDYRHWCGVVKVLVDTRFVNELVNFMWYVLKTNHSTYYIGKPQNYMGNEILRMFNRTRIEMHTLIALLANIPNPNNYEYVDSLAWSDNRVDNLFWTQTRPYKLKYGEDLEYPDDVDKDLSIQNITWHVTNANELTGRQTFFKVDHPYLRDKSWITSKSSKLTNQQKLDQALKKFQELNQVYNCPVKLKLCIEREKFIELIDEYDEEQNNR